MGRQLDFNIPDDDSILKSISDLMVEKAFETKVSINSQKCFFYPISCGILWLKHRFILHLVSRDRGEFEGERKRRSIPTPT